MDISHTIMFKVSLSLREQLPISDKVYSINSTSKDVRRTRSFNLNEERGTIYREIEREQAEMEAGK